MGIVSRNELLEDYLSGIGVEWHALSDKEYRLLIKQWRESFEENLANDVTVSGSKAILLLEEKLPFTGYLFNCPNYRYLPFTVSSESGRFTFAYKIIGLPGIDRASFNELEFIMCDMNYEYMCVFNHEAPDWFPEIYCEGTSE